MDSGWYGARLQRGARLPTHIATRPLVSLSVHRAHDPIAALESQRGGIEPARRDRQRQRQHSDNGHKPSHRAFYPSCMLIPLGKSMQTRVLLAGFPPLGLDSRDHHRYRKCMAQSFLVFDFGSDEELAQQARHKVDGWKQGFRLDKKLLLKFNRSDASDAGAKADDETEAQSEKKGGAKPRRKKPAETSTKENIQLIIRLDFSDHERLSYQRWLERIPTEVPFKDAQSKIIRQNDAEFAGTAERFESLS
jgi:hypothetical protein